MENLYSFNANSIPILNSKPFKFGKFVNLIDGDLDLILQELQVEGKKGNDCVFILAVFCYLCYLFPYLCHLFPLRTPPKIK